MEIYRRYGGQRVAHTLSKAELHEAYLEQQHIYDVDDIRNGLDTDHEYYAEKYGISEKPVTNNEIEEMARLLRHFLDSEADSTWSVCVQDAITKILKKRG